MDIQTELQIQYAHRFTPLEAYRDRVWRILTAKFFQKLIPADSTVLDLGCGWGEFINNIVATKKYAMDLNRDAADKLAHGIEFLCQDCSAEWQLADDSLDIVFTSNFFEHLRSKDDLKSTLEQSWRCLKPGGTIICLGPNIKYLPGSYWDFWDHYLPLSELSLKEILDILGFDVTRCVPRFLPYTMVGQRQPSLKLVRLYLKLPLMWRFFGRQFLVIAQKRHTGESPPVVTRQIVHKDK